jgi:hypothetical protein
MIETGVGYFSARTLRHVCADLEHIVAHNLWGAKTPSISVGRRPLAATVRG